MNKQNRLDELLSYKILDTPPEKTLDEFVEIAATICDTPIALISILDEKRQWFKAKIGLDVTETPIEDSFCQYTLYSPDSIMVINDALADKRFVNNPLVVGDPHIRFYAGAPLVTPEGNVLGTICTIDKKPKEITERQKKALCLLSIKIMDHFNASNYISKQKKIISKTANRLRHITDHLPGAIFEFEMNANGKMSMPFVSHGIFKLYPSLDTNTEVITPEMIFQAIHPDDLPKVVQSIESSFQTLNTYVVEFRVMKNNESIEWHKVIASPERKKNGTVWYGTVQNITNQLEYENTLEQMAFDISHVLRRPVSTLLGLTNIIEKDKAIDPAKLKKYVSFIKTVSEELDAFTRQLNKAYKMKKRLSDTLRF